MSFPESAIVKELRRLMDEMRSASPEGFIAKSKEFMEAMKKLDSAIKTYRESATFTSNPFQNFKPVAAFGLEIITFLNTIASNPNLEMLRFCQAQVKAIETIFNNILGSLKPAENSLWKSVVSALKLFTSKITTKEFLDKIEAIEKAIAAKMAAEKIAIEKAAGELARRTSSALSSASTSSVSLSSASIGSSSSPDTVAAVSLLARYKAVFSKISQEDPAEAVDGHGDFSDKDIVEALTVLELILDLATLKEKEELRETVFHAALGHQLCHLAAFLYEQFTIEPSEVSVSLAKKLAMLLKHEAFRRHNHCDLTLVWDMLKSIDKSIADSPVPTVSLGPSAPSVEKEIAKPTSSVEEDLSKSERKEVADTPELPLPTRFARRTLTAAAVAGKSIDKKITTELEALKKLSLEGILTFCDLRFKAKTAWSREMLLYILGGFGSAGDANRNSYQIAKKLRKDAVSAVKAAWQLINSQIPKEAERKGWKIVNEFIYELKIIGSEEISTLCRNLENASILSSALLSKFRKNLEASWRPFLDQQATINAHRRSWGLIEKDIFEKPIDSIIRKLLIETASQLESFHLTDIARLCSHLTNARILYADIFERIQKILQEEWECFDEKQLEKLITAYQVKSMRVFFTQKRSKGKRGASLTTECSTLELVHPHINQMTPIIEFLEMMGSKNPDLIRRSLVLASLAIADLCGNPTESSDKIERGSALEAVKCIGNLSHSIGILSHYISESAAGSLAIQNLQKIILEFNGKFSLEKSLDNGATHEEVNQYKRGMRSMAVQTREHVAASSSASSSDSYFDLCLRTDQVENEDMEQTLFADNVYRAIAGAFKLNTETRKGILSNGKSGEHAITLRREKLIKPFQYDFLLCKDNYTFTIEANGRLYHYLINVFPDGRDPTWELNGKSMVKRQLVHGKLFIDDPNKEFRTCLPGESGKMNLAIDIFQDDYEAERKISRDYNFIKDLVSTAIATEEARRKAERGVALAKKIETKRLAEAREKEKLRVALLETAKINKMERKLAAEEGLRVAKEKPVAVVTKPVAVVAKSATAVVSGAESAVGAGSFAKTGSLVGSDSPAGTGSPAEVTSSAGASSSVGAGSYPRKKESAKKEVLKKKLLNSQAAEFVPSSETSLDPVGPSATQLDPLMPPSYPAQPLPAHPLPPTFPVEPSVMPDEVYPDPYMWSGRSDPYLAPDPMSFASDRKITTEFYRMRETAELMEWRAWQQLMAPTCGYLYPYPMGYGYPMSHGAMYPMWHASPTSASEHAFLHTPVFAHPVPPHVSVPTPASVHTPAPVSTHTAASSSTGTSSMPPPETAERTASGNVINFIQINHTQFSPQFSPQFALFQVQLAAASSSGPPEPPTTKAPTSIPHDPRAPGAATTGLTATGTEVSSHTLSEAEALRKKIASLGVIKASTKAT